jgi:putative Holliday junction resolvase
MILALDYGEKRIGVAVTDETERFVKALDFIPNRSEPKKIFAKEFPAGTSIQDINKARKQSKFDAKVDFKKICNRLLYLVNCYYPNKIIIGLPTTVDQETGETVYGQQAKKVQQFTKKIESCFKSNGIVLDVELIEESLTSIIAEKQLRDMGVPTKRIKDNIDSASAKVLLESYLNKG